MPLLRPTGGGNRLSLLTSVLLTAALAGLLVYWGLQLGAPRVSIAPGGSLVDQRGSPDTLAAGRLFGMPGQGGPRPARLPANIKVIGVIASESRSAVVLQVNNQPPAPFAVGASVDGSLVVKKVSRDEVVLERDGEELRAPAPPRADISILSSHGTGEARPLAGGPQGAPADATRPAMGGHRPPDSVAGAPNSGRTPVAPRIGPGVAMQREAPRDPRQDG